MRLLEGDAGHQRASHWPASSPSSSRGPRRVRQATRVAPVCLRAIRRDGAGPVCPARRTRGRPTCACAVRCQPLTNVSGRRLAPGPGATRKHARGTTTALQVCSVLRPPPREVFLLLFARRRQLRSSVPPTMQPGAEAPPASRAAAAARALRAAAGRALRWRGADGRGLCLQTWLLILAGILTMARLLERVEPVLMLVPPVLALAIAVPAARALGNPLRSGARSARMLRLLEMPAAMVFFAGWAWIDVASRPERHRADRHERPSIHDGPR